MQICSGKYVFKNILPGFIEDTNNLYFEIILLYLLPECQVQKQLMPRQKVLLLADEE